MDSNTIYCGPLVAESGTEYYCMMLPRSSPDEKHYWKLQQFNTPTHFCIPWSTYERTDVHQRCRTKYNHYNLVIISSKSEFKAVITQPARKLKITLTRKEVKQI